MSAADLRGPKRRNDAAPDFFTAAIHAPRATATVAVEAAKAAAEMGGNPVEAFMGIYVSWLSG